MKRNDLIRKLARQGCLLKREGRSHSLWLNQKTGNVETIPRHREIPDILAKKIYRKLTALD